MSRIIWSRSSPAGHVPGVGSEATSATIPHTRNVPTSAALLGRESRLPQLLQHPLGDPQARLGGEDPAQGQARERGMRADRRQERAQDVVQPLVPAAVARLGQLHRRDQVVG
nr:hypothetical protein GCM10020092_004690 [Actinoplanes digitatis]